MESSREKIKSAYETNMKRLKAMVDADEILSIQHDRLLTGLKTVTDALTGRKGAE